MSDNTPPAGGPTPGIPGTPGSPPVPPQPGPGTYRVFPAQAQAFPHDDPSKPLPPEEYRTKVLPGLMNQAAQQPQLLHEVLLGALRIGAMEEAEPCARRLLELEGGSARSVALLGLVLIQKQSFEEADSLLRGHLASQGKSPAVQLQLARLLQAQGQKDESEDALWEVLEVEPNLPDAVIWWAQIKHGEDDQLGYYQGLQQVDAIDGSWFARLCMARLHLQHREPDEAISLYEGALPAAAVNADALAMISGDLGQAGRFDDAVRLVGPHYDAKKHGPVPGLNLAAACAKVGDKGRGLEFLGHVESLELEPFAQHCAQVRKLLDAVGG